MSRFVVFGATGYAGGHIVTELVARGHSVVGVSRHPVNAEGVRPVAGSIFDVAFVNDVIRGVDGIVVALRMFGDPPIAHAIPSLLSAAESAEARLGVVGGAGSLHVFEGGPRLVDTPEFPEAAKPEALAAAVVLEDLRASASDVDWFFLSPAAGFGAYNPGERTGHYRIDGDVVVKDADGKSAISGADYAIAFVDELETPKHHRQRFAVGY